MSWAIAVLAACAAGAAVGAAASALPYPGILDVAIGIVGGLGAAVIGVRPGVDFIRPLAAGFLGYSGDEAAGRHDLTVCYAGADEAWAAWAAGTLAVAGFHPRLCDVRYVDPAERNGRFLVIAGAVLAVAPEAAKALSRLTGAAGERAAVVHVDVGLGERGDDPDTHLAGASSGYVISNAMAGYTARDIVARAVADHGWRPGRRPPERQGPSSALGDADRYPGSEPPVWPAAMPADIRTFEDRKDLLATLFTRLVAEEGTADSFRACALDGLGGIGKTAAAVKFVQCSRAYFDAVAWISAGQPTAIAGGFTDLAAQLGVTAGDLPQRMPVIWRELRKRGRWLVVFDDALDEGSLARWWPPPDSHGAVLVTSNSPAWLRADPEKVAVLGSESAVNLLCRASDSADRAGAARLADKLGYLPLALSQAASYVAQDPMTWSEYESVYDRQPLRMMGMTDETADQASSRSWAAAVERVRGKMPGAESLLYLLAFLSPDGLPRGLLSAHPDVLPEPLGDIAADPADLHQARHLLAGYSLITVTDTTISAHRLVQDFTRNTLPAAGQATWAAAAVRLLEAAFPAEPGSTAAWPECARLVRHVVTATDYAANLDAEPAATAAVAQRAAEYLAAARVNQQTALRLTDRACSLGTKCLGPDSGEVAEAMITRARVLHNIGRVPDAVASAEGAVGILGRAGPGQGGNARALVNALIWLSDALIESGKAAEAVPHLERALAVAEEDPGPGPATATVLARLGYARYRLGEPGPAQDALTRALGIWAAAPDPPSHERVVATRRLGTVLKEMGDLDGALAREREARRVAAGMDTEAFRVDDAIASVLARRGASTGDSADLAEAERLQRQALRSFEAAGMLDHVSAGTRKNLAQTLLYAGRPAQALAEAEAALATAEGLRGCDHPYGAEILLTLGRAQRATGDIDAARASLERARTIYETSYGPGYLHLAPVLDELAAVAREEEDEDTARLLAARAQGIRDGAGLRENPL